MDIAKHIQDIEQDLINHKAISLANFNRIAECLDAIRIALDANNKHLALIEGRLKSPSQPCDDDKSSISH